MFKKVPLFIVSLLTIIALKPWADVYLLTRNGFELGRSSHMTRKVSLKRSFSSWPYHMCINYLQQGEFYY